MKIIDKIFKLQNVSILNINTDKLVKVEFYDLMLNFDKSNIIDSILNFKFIPFYKYREHINNLKIPVNLNFYFKKKDINLIIKYMKSDKKNNSSKINLILIKKIGKVILNLKYSQSKIKKFLIDELIY